MPPTKPRKLAKLRRAGGVTLDLATLGPLFRYLFTGKTVWQSWSALGTTLVIATEALGRFQVEACAPAAPLFSLTTCTWVLQAVQILGVLVAVAGLRRAPREISPS